MKEEYVKIEIKSNNYKLKIVKTTDTSWLDTYYFGAGVFLGTICLKSKLNKKLAMFKKRALKDLIKEREKTEKTIRQIDKNFLVNYELKQLTKY